MCFFRCRYVYAVRIVTIFICEMLLLIFEFLYIRKSRILTSHFALCVVMKSTHCHIIMVNMWTFRRRISTRMNIESLASIAPLLWRKLFLSDLVLHWFQHTLALERRVVLSSVSLTNDYEYIWAKRIAVGLSREDRTTTWRYWPKFTRNIRGQSNRKWRNSIIWIKISSEHSL